MKWYVILKFFWGFLIMYRAREWGGGDGGGGGGGEGGCGGGWGEVKVE